jgi:hypothetical protein
MASAANFKLTEEISFTCDLQTQAYCEDEQINRFSPLRFESGKPADGWFASPATPC